MAGGSHGQGLIEDLYQTIFNEVFDADEAEARMERALPKQPEKVKMEPGAYIDGKSKYEASLISLPIRAPSTMAIVGTGQTPIGELISRSGEPSPTS